MQEDKKKNINIVNNLVIIKQDYNTLKLLLSINDIDLPILAKAQYLSTKSNKFGWFISDTFILPFFLDARGIFTRLVFTTSPIYSSSKDNKDEDLLYFLDNIIQLTKLNKLCDFILKPQSNVVFSTPPSDSIFVQWGTYVVDINIPEDKLFLSFNSKSKNIIRKAIENNIIVKKTNDYDLLYNNIKQTLKRQNSVHYPSIEYLRKLAIMDDSVVFFTAMSGEILQGSLVVVYDNKTAYAMYAGSIKRPFSGSIDLLHFKAMNYFQNKNILEYDFVGTRINIKKGSKQEGIDRFKRKFNPVLRKGYTFKVIFNPIKYYIYVAFSKLYFKCKGFSYSDPISVISKESLDDKILLIGPRYNKRKPYMISGPIVLFEGLIKEFNQNNINYSVIDTNKLNYNVYFLSYFMILIQLIKTIPSNQHITLHSSKDYMFFMPIILFYSKVWNKKVSLRKFGGETQNIYMNANFIFKKYLKYIFSNVDNLFFETKSLVNHFKNVNKNTFWFPNVRNRIAMIKEKKEYTKKFVFISHVIPTKGIDEILQAFTKLDKSYTIDIYGPMLYDYYNPKNFIGYDNITYKGALEPKEVIPILSQYDVLVLPSYKEGYPGIVIESYSLGIPVITTNLDSIREIVDDYKTGILINPKNVYELFDAIKYFDIENYKTMSKLAYEKFNLFESTLNTKKFINIIIDD